MSILSQKIPFRSKSTVIIMAVAMIALIAVPGFVLSSHKSKLYVRASASGTQDGSSAHPFKTINQAMRAAKKNTEIHISNGFYKENVDMRSNVDIYGESKKGVIIEASDRDKAVVQMANDTTIDKVTLQKGRYGIKVDDDAKASIIECLVRDNKKAGIYTQADGVKKSRQVIISENEITDNDGAGIYSGKRKLSITENEITDNDGDGIDIEKGSEAWIADNKVNDNDKSGMKLRIDGSTIWTRSNSFRDNKREGMEISFSGAAGRINISKTKVISNNRYGVARVQRLPIAGSVGLWNKYLTFDNKNTIDKNKSGGISPIIVVK